MDRRRENNFLLTYNNINYFLNTNHDSSIEENLLMTTSKRKNLKPHLLQNKLNREKASKIVLETEWNYFYWNC